ncbi:kinesin-like protein Klp98A [Nilaparvata lugens]|uniref:kinesin-like protein Klp98A n=1 Tax=Nilaparvata lugens TaxID=108931 RepID=UPI00193E955E|nr:kinesin-like protein Klp98A [Nilaparvata lugens]
MASVKVAVRVRPFNQREIDMNAKCIIKMEGKKTRITNTSQKGNERQGELNKFFTFDHSYWSFDHNDPHYISQEQVFNDLGTDVVDAAFEGYNACVFAYGQTGSGKTFTMMGSKSNQGLMPRICEALFKRMALGANYRIEVSYLEIYNEKVKDLLLKDSGHNLKVRQHPTKGPCVMDLSRHLVSEYKHIQDLMEQGNNQRTTASTNMNDVSSRSHAIFTLMFVQAQGGLSNDVPTETVSKVHLVDLAGSERADASGATGQRLKEGAHINKSLVTLGSVISALAELSAGVSGRKAGGFIPYRDSVLTWLLKDSLGGNSKTIMIAAVSPADCNYSETLSTLRYANRAKNIINKPTINEDENVKLIRELREEITKLKSMMTESEGATEVQPKVLAVLQEKEAQEKVLREEWNEKWRETQKILQEQKALGLRKAGAGAGIVLDSDMPHLIGIDDDLLSTGVTLYHLNDGETLVGSSDADGDRQDIILNGVDVEKHHCSITLKNGVATLVPHHEALCWVNGSQVNKPTRLSQGCNILLGRTNLFRYNDPVEVEKLKKEGNSHSVLNLSRLSLMSCSTPDLCRDVENNNGSFRRPGSVVSESGRSREDILESREDILNESSIIREDDVHLSLREREQVLKKSIDQFNSDQESKLSFLASEHKRIVELQANLDRKKEELTLLEMKQTQFRRDSLNGTTEIDVNVLNNFKDSINNMEQELKLQNETLSVIVRNANENEKNFKRQNLNLSLVSGNDHQPLATSSPNITVNSNRIIEDLESPLSDSPRNFNLQMQQRTMFRKMSVDVDLDTDALYQMKFLTQQISNQRRLIMKCLESEINSDELNKHISVLQELKREYVRLEQQTDDCSSKENFKMDANGATQSSGTMSHDHLSHDSDDLSTSADDTISESLMGSRVFKSRDCLNCSVLSRSSRDIRYRILQDRLQMSLAPPSFSASIQDVNQLTSSNNYSLTRSMPSLNRISVWERRLNDSDWDQRLIVSVPNYLIRGAGRNTHYVYEVLVCVEGETYSILRRYRRFRELHLTMKHKYGDQVAKLSFPPRKLFLWQMDGELLAKERRPLLEIYLKRLLATCASISTCPLHNSCSKTALHQFSTFFKKGVFETGKYGTS